jgi:hypothetical protein
VLFVVVVRTDKPTNTPAGSREPTNRAASSAYRWQRIDRPFPYLVVAAFRTSFMAGKKRGAAAASSSSSNMWSSSKAKKNKKNGGSGSSGSAGSSSSEAMAAKLFAELADPDDPDTINMEGA